MVWNQSLWKFANSNGNPNANKTPILYSFDHGRPQEFSQGGNIHILLIFFKLLRMQCKRTLTKHFTISRPKVGMGARRGQGSPWTLKSDIFLLYFKQKCWFFGFEWVKWNFVTFGPFWKNRFGHPPWKNPQLASSKISFRRPRYGNRCNNVLRWDP